MARKSKPRRKSSSGVGWAAPPGSPLALTARDRSTGLLHVVVDTPRGSPVKFKYDLEKRSYTIAHVLPPGMMFPFDFGSIPRTLEGDGDPIDVLILLEWPSFAGCVIPVRLVGVLEAEQTQEGRTSRNDRLVGAAAESRAYRDVRSLKDLPGKLLEELEHFFVSYNEERGREFRVVGRFGPRRAARLVEAGERRFRRQRAGGSGKA